MADEVYEEKSVDNCAGFENDYPKMKKKSRAMSVFSWLETLLTAVCVALILIVGFVRLTEVEGSSMKPTLENGDKMLVYQFMYEPCYDDLVAIKLEAISTENDSYIVKRIIGLEGDVIGIDENTGAIVRNGEALEEDYILEPIDKYHMGNLTEGITVPEGCVFVLGDNRNNSVDSRYVDSFYVGYPVGCIDKDYIMGKVFFRILPFEKFGVI